MPSKTYSIGNKSASIALRYATGKYCNVSRGIVEMERCIQTLESANKMKAAKIKALQETFKKYHLV